jgi:hypothetical protein
MGDYQKDTENTSASSDTKKALPRIGVELAEQCFREGILLSEYGRPSIAAPDLPARRGFIVRPAACLRATSQPS